MRIKKVIALVMAFIAFYFIGITEVLSVEGGEMKTEIEKPPVVILDAKVTEISDETMFFKANVFGETHPFHIPADSAPELNVGDECLLAMEMVNQDIIKSWEVRGIR